MKNANELQKQLCHMSHHSKMKGQGKNEIN